jgi:hypothetical protein
MKGKLLLGSILIVVGFVVAVFTVTGVNQPAQTRDVTKVIVGDQNQAYRDEAASIVIPIIAGVAVAAGAMLVGIGMASFRRPKIVPSDSPEADEAATTRPLTDDTASKPRRKAGA